jgi:hypothetical protein
VVNGVCQTITSGGLWGIESDSSRQYLSEVEQEGEDRTLLSAYKDPKRKPKLETAISKVRRDMRKAGLLKRPLTTCH